MAFATDAVGEDRVPASWYGATGGSMKKVVRRVRSRVSKNKRRLSR